MISWIDPGATLQLLGHGLRERGANVLPHFHLAGANGDFALLAEVQPRIDILRQRFTGPSADAAGFLPGKKGITKAEDHDAAAQELEEIAPWKSKVISGARSQFVSLGLELRRKIVGRYSRAHLLYGLRRPSNGGNDARIRPAAADVALEVVGDLLFRRIGMNL